MEWALLDTFAVASIMLSPRFHSSDGVRSIVHACMERLMVLVVLAVLVELHSCVAICAIRVKRCDYPLGVGKDAGRGGLGRVLGGCDGGHHWMESESESESELREEAGMIKQT